MQSLREKIVFDTWIFMCAARKADPEVLLSQPQSSACQDEATILSGRIRSMSQTNLSIRLSAVSSDCLHPTGMWNAKSSLTGSVI